MTSPILAKYRSLSMVGTGSGVMADPWIVFLQSAVQGSVSQPSTIRQANWRPPLISKKKDRS